LALEFDKVLPQVEKMGVAMAHRSATISEQTEAAGQRLLELNDLNAIWEMIYLARERDAGFRGAAPITEPINVGIDLPDEPHIATILASDGSQIYPDLHGASLYWLINIGIFVYMHGTDDLPKCISEPQLFYEDHDVRDREGRVIANAAINARRGVNEMQMLARAALGYRHMPRPLMALYDGPLLTLPMGKEVANAAELSSNYHEAMSLLQDVNAALAGYVDRPKSTFVVSTIFLTSLSPDKVIRSNLQTAGPFEGLTDRDLYQWILGPGQRCGLMIQQSPQNKAYKEQNADQEIVFFYLNVAGPHQEPYLARVEVPMWVAKDKVYVDAVHALAYAQCQITDRYPYALTRADEVAVIPTHDKRTLDEMIAVELLRNRQPVEISQKLSMKGAARSSHQKHRGV
jgi:hypothetical protein